MNRRITITIGPPSDHGVFTAELSHPDGRSMRGRGPTIPMAMRELGRQIAELKQEEDITYQEVFERLSHEVNHSEEGTLA